METIGNKLALHSPQVGLRRKLALDAVEDHVERAGENAGILRLSLWYVRKSYIRKSHIWRNDTRENAGLLLIRSFRD